MEWVSNMVPVDKKQGTINVYVDYHNLNATCPKYNYPTPFIDQIIDDCAGYESFFFIDGFLDYNHIAIKLVDQHKTTFICPWGIFSYRKLPFGLNNVGATFQRDMEYAFHDIRNTFQAYLDDLLTHSKKQAEHVAHLRAIFLRCRFYNIHMNLHQSIFFVKSRCLLGFIAFNHGIRVDHDNVKAITQFPVPQCILQLQSLQGKENVLCHFIVNYTLLIKAFHTCGTINLNDHLMHWNMHSYISPLLIPLDYLQNFLLYLVASPSSIGMVLVQTHDDHSEHVVYYLSKGCVGHELQYSHVEKLYLAVVFSTNGFRHYFLLWENTVIALKNPMRHILSCQIIGGKYSKWIVILQ